MDKIVVYDDFLPSRFLEEIKSLFENQYVNWFHSPSTTSEKINMPEIIDTQLFNHNILFNNEKSILYNVLHPFHYFIESTAQIQISEMYRIRANFTFPVPNFTENNFNTPHCDSNSKLVSALYYVNDSDGDTFFFNKVKGENLDNVKIIKRISPKSNRMIFFPSNRYHAGSNPIKNQSRIVINFMFSQKDNSTEERLVGIR